MDLDGKMALATGGSGGLGRQICLALANAGASAAIAYNSGRERAEQFKSEIEGNGGHAACFELDQTDEQAIQATVGEVVGRFGGLDVLVNNAAMAKGIPFPDLEKLTPAIWDETMRVNLRGPFLVSRAAAPHLGASGQGRIVNIAAMAGIKPMGASIAQSVSKPALIQLTRCLAVALAPNATVNCVAPGLMEGTLLTAGISEAFLDSFKSNAVLNTTTSLEDVAGQVAQFCRSDTVTGQVLVIDGGIHFH